MTLPDVEYGLFPICGTAIVEVELQNKCATQLVTILKGGGSVLLGRDWLCMLKLDWETLLHVKSIGIEEIEE